MEWLKDAACRYSPDPDIFFAADTDTSEPGKPNKVNQVNIARALAICSTCPVREACLEYALTTREPYGVWGGMTARERRKHPGQMALGVA